MKREIIMVSAIVALVVAGHIFTQKYTQNFFEKIETNLHELQEQVLVISKNNSEKNNNQSNIENKTELNENNLKEKIKEIRTMWNNKYNKLAYFTEHDELEKIGAQIAIISGYFEGREYENSLAEIDRTIFLLKHIRDKDNFSLVNIF